MKFCGMFRTFTAVFAAIAMSAVGITVAVANVNEPVFGTWGEAPWSWNDTDGVLTVTGSTDPQTPTYKLGADGTQPWTGSSGFENTDVNQIVFQNPKGIELLPDSENLFKDLSNVTEMVGVGDVKTDSVTTMKNMFLGNASLTELDLSGWGTSQLEDMEGMFSGAMSLVKLDISNFDISGVEQSSGSNVFTDVPLEVLKLGRNTKIGNLNSVGIWDNSLKSGSWQSRSDVSGEFSEIGDADAFLDFTLGPVFEGGSFYLRWNSTLIYDLDGGGEVTDFPAETVLSWTDFAVSSKLPVKDGYNFLGWKKGDDLSLVRPSEQIVMPSVETTLLAQWDSEWGDVPYVWDQTDGTMTLTGAEFGSEPFVLGGYGEQPWKKGGVIDADDVEKIVFTNPTGIKLEEDCSGLFSELPNLKEMPGLEQVDVSEVTTMVSMFEGAESLTTLDLSGWGTSSVLTKLESMFKDASSLVSLKLANWDVSGVGTMTSMFEGASELVELDVSGWDVTDALTDLSYMFKDASSLTSLNLTDWNVSNVISMEYMFKGATKLTELKIDGWNTTDELIYLESMFQDASALVSLDLSDWDVSGAEDMDYMFQDASALSDLNISSWDTQNVDSMVDMFLDAGIEVLHLGSNTVLGAEANLWDGETGVNALWYRGVSVGLNSAFGASFELVGDADTLLEATEASGFDGGTFYLRWHFTLSYDLDQGSDPDGHFGEQQVLFFDEYQVPTEVPIRENHSFMGWEDEDDNLVLPGTVFEMPKADTELVAKWERNPDPVELEVTRFEGANRYVTNLKVNAQFGGEGPIFVATGNNFADALSVASAVNKVGGTLFLTASNQITLEALAAIKISNTQEVYVVGGQVAVSKSVEAYIQVVTGVKANRIAGVNRYETSRIIYKEFFDGEIEEFDAAFVATGLEFPDAISASAAAGSLGAPVLLVDGKKGDGLEQDVVDSLKTHTDSVLIVGGEAAVNGDIERSIKADFEVERLAGDNRYETNLAINGYLNEGFEMEALSSVWVATGMNFPDALSAAVPAGDVTSRLVLSPGTCIPFPVVSEWIKGEDSQVSAVNLVGGTKVLSAGVENLTECVK